MPPVKRKKTAKKRSVNHFDDDDDESDTEYNDPTAPKRKKQKYSKNSESKIFGKKEKTVKEKRLARWVGKMSKAVSERVGKAVTQRLYVIERKTIEPSKHEKVIVLGTTGNVYEVNICKTPNCNCVDFSDGNICKHILFVYLKVLKVRVSSDLIYQKALLNSELENIFENAPAKIIPDNFCADSKVVEMYERLNEEQKKGLKTDSEKEQEMMKHRKQLKKGESICPICYEDMSLESSDKITFCYVCGNNIHQDCWNKWRQSHSQRTASHHTHANDSAKDAVPTCVYCRAKNMGRDVRKDDSKNIGEEGYINLATYQHDCSTTRIPSPSSDDDNLVYDYYYGELKYRPNY